MTRLSPADLWQQADGDRQRYVQLLREHGLLVDRTGPRCPVKVCTSAGSVAQCQSEAGHTGCHFAAVAGFWSDGDDRILPVVLEETHHRAARERAEDEEDRIAGRHATGGVIEGPRDTHDDTHDDTIPAYLTRDCGPVPTAEQRRAVIAKLKAQHAEQVAKAHGGQGVLPTIGES